VAEPIPGQKEPNIESPAVFDLQKRGSEKNSEESVKRPSNGLPCAVSHHPQQEGWQKSFLSPVREEKIMQHRP